MDDGASSRLPLVGRDVELRRLLDAAAAAAANRRAAALVIVGDSGAGKTRLVEELLARLRLDGVTVAAARAIESDRVEPWSGALALARGGLAEVPGVAAAPAPAIAAFLAAAPAWAERFPGAAAAEPSPFPRALREIVRAAADEAPVVLAVDDAQWLDAESAGGARGLLRDLPPAPLCLVLALSPTRRGPISMSSGAGSAATWRARRSRSARSAPPPCACWPDGCCRGTTTSSSTAWCVGSAPTRRGFRCSRSSCCARSRRDSTCARAPLRLARAVQDAGPVPARRPARCARGGHPHRLPPALSADARTGPRRGRRAGRPRRAEPAGCRARPPARGGARGARRARVDPLARRRAAGLWVRRPPRSAGDRAGHAHPRPAAAAALGRPGRSSGTRLTPT